MTLQCPIHTRYSETAQDGIIHHSSYVVYFEVARLEFFEHIGCDINELEKNKILCPVIDLSVKYIKPLRSLEDIIVTVSMGEFSKVRFNLNYEILREGERIAKASISHCFIDKTFKPIPIPKNILERFGLLKG